MCYEALASPMVYLGSCPHRLHLPCFAALRVLEAANLRCPVCRANVTVEEADRTDLLQHSEEVTAHAMAVARRAMAARGGELSSTRTARDGRGDRVIHSVCHGLVEETAFVQVSCSSDVHVRCAPGFVKDAIPQVKPNGASTHMYTPDHVPEPGPTCGCIQRGIYTPFFHRSVFSANRRTW